MRLAAELVWRKDVLPVPGEMPRNVLEVWTCCFNGMFNNAIDYLRGPDVELTIARAANYALLKFQEICVVIFNKIYAEIELVDERHAIQELAKGKLTIDPIVRPLLRRLVLCARVWLGPQTGAPMFINLDHYLHRTEIQRFDEYSPGENHGAGLCCSRRWRSISPSCTRVVRYLRGSCSVYS